MIYKKINNEILTETKTFLKSSKKKHHTSLISNTSTKIKKLKKQYKIKSTEKTFIDIKYVSKKPNYINFNETNNQIINLDYIFTNKIANYNNEPIIKKVSQVYLKTKQEFYDKFYNLKNNKCLIQDLNDFDIFIKNNLFFDTNNNINILISFYNNDKQMYIFISKNKMIKILNNKEYDEICNMIEKNNGIFMLEDGDKNNIIGYGSKLNLKIDSKHIKKIFFFNNLNYETNKNYKLLCEYNFVKIYFYVCNKI